MTHIDLFSGIGGFALAAHWAGFTTEVFCEQDEFCQQVLNRHWPAVPVVSDIRDFDGSAYRGADLLTGGFPCQPFSCAGKQQGDQDDRFLWPEMLRVISESRPHWIVGENVAGIINMALDGVLSDLENEGYATQAFVVPACAVNAPHRRDRVWIVAHARRFDGDGRTGVCAGNSITNRSRFTNREEAERTAIGDDQDVANPNRHDQHGRTIGVQMGRVWCESETENDGHPGSAEWTTQSRMGDMAHGLPGRLAGHFDAEPAHIPRIATGVPQRAARLKALGNAIVPQVAYEILRHLPLIA